MCVYVCVCLYVRVCLCVCVIITGCLRCVCFGCLFAFYVQLFLGFSLSIIRAYLDALYSVHSEGRRFGDNSK